MVKDLTVLIVRILIRRRTIISKNGWSHAKHALCNGKRVGGSNAFMKGNYDFIEGAIISLEDTNETLNRNVRKNSIKMSLTLHKN